MAAAVTMLSLLVVGAAPFGSILLRLARANPRVWGILSLVAIGCILLCVGGQRARRIAAMGLILMAAAINLSRFIHWASGREYRIINTADILSRALEPTEIAGNWASILSIGTPHRTHLLSGEMGINWRSDFLSEHNIRYLLLTRGPFADEYREYMRLFSKQMSRAKLMAVFPIYTARVQLWALFPPPESRARIEMEALTRRPGRVTYDGDASNKMVFTLPEGSECRLPLEFEPDAEKAARIELRARGRFRMHIALHAEGSLVKRNLVVWKSAEYDTRPILSGPIPANAVATISIASRNDGAHLDWIRAVAED